MRGCRQKPGTWEIEKPVKVEEFEAIPATIALLPIAGGLAVAGKSKSVHYPDWRCAARRPESPNVVFGALI